MLKPKHTFQSVVEELVHGLETGSITLKNASDDSPSKEQLGALLLVLSSSDTIDEAAKRMGMSHDEFVRFSEDGLKKIGQRWNRLKGQALGEPVR